MKRIVSLTAAALGVAGLAACVVDEGPNNPSSPAGVEQVGANPAPAGWRAVTYRCAGGQTLNARFSPAGDQVQIEQVGENILLKQVVSGSGARYAAVDKNYSYSLDTKGDWAALYESGDRVVLNDCKRS